MKLKTNSFHIQKKIVIKLKNSLLIASIFILFSFLAMSYFFIFVFSTYNILLLIIFEIILFFIIIGISIQIYEILSNKETYDYDIQQEFIKSPNYTRRLEKTYTNNKKIKDRKKYHEKKVSKKHRHHKGLISKKDYYKKKGSSAAIKYGGWYLFPPF